MRPRLHSPSRLSAYPSLRPYVYRHTLPSPSAFVHPTYYPLTRLFAHPSISLHDYRPNRLSTYASIRPHVYPTTAHSLYLTLSNMSIKLPTIRPTVYQAALLSTHPSIYIRVYLPSRVTVLTAYSYLCPPVYPPTRP